MSMDFYVSGCIDDDKAPSVNMSNSNAAMIIRSLGIEFDYCGHIDPIDLIRAIAKADPIDSGVPSHTFKEPGKATMIEGGIRPGYHAEKYADLLAVAMYAIRVDAEVIWA